jgi:hypothetical protein
VGSCLAVLQREGWLRRIAPTERPGIVTFTGMAGETQGLRGKIFVHLCGLLAREGHPGASTPAGLPPVPPRDATIGVWPDRVAEELDLSREQVTAALRGLEERKVLDYAAPERAGGVEILRPGEMLTLDEPAMRARRARENLKLQRMVDYAAAACRRRYVLQYFGDTLPWERCGACDACREGRPLEAGPLPLAPDEETIVRKVLSCLARMGQPFSPAMVARVVTGSREESVTAWKFERLSTFGILSQLSQKDVELIVGELVRAGALARDTVTRDVGGQQRTFAVVDFTPLGQDVMFQRAESFAMHFPLGKPAAQRASTAGRTLPSAVSSDLLVHLREVRTRLARAEDVPAYVIAPNRTLDDMAAQRPASKTAMLGVHGMGPERARKYADAFLEAIRGWERG